MDLWERQLRRLQSEAGLKKSLKERESLPIFAYENYVMDAINDHPVVVIRGNTGSGKSTQVR